ncbi:hypothetical protein [Methanosalsum natronophilum]|uniref:hypothetical protein n=1 Tax=Methanosalsum natronophilum TaxID=768733 RepID=UPI00216A935A|nr:hypothetical protein [Methanosalsum natronophilum]MCS3924569.1 hypothetical protein [Methanosalsum natronophilum]
MTSGLLLNAVICFAISISALTLTWLLVKNSADYDAKAKPALWALISFWVLVGFIYIPTTLRMIAAYQGNTLFDLIFYHLASIFFAFVSVPIIFFIVYIVTGNKKVTFIVSFFFTIVGIIYLYILSTYGVVGPVVLDWSSLITVNSDFAIHLYLALLFVIPTAMILGLFFLMLIQRIKLGILYKKALPLVAISFVLDFILIDFIVMIDPMQLFARTFILIGIILAFLAYFPPEVLKEEKFDYEDIDLEIELESEVNGSLGDINEK